MAFRPLVVSDVVRIIDKASEHWSRDALVEAVSFDDRKALVRVYVNSEPFWIDQKSTILSDSVWTVEGARTTWQLELDSATNEDTGDELEYEACGNCECCMAHRYN